MSNRVVALGALGLNVALLVAGQILFKLGLQKTGGLSAATALKIWLSPYIMLGLALYALATGLWFLVLSRMELSLAYPLQSSAYILGVLAAWLIFGEQVPVTRWVGLVVITVGILLVARR